MLAISQLTCSTFQKPLEMIIRNEMIVKLKNYNLIKDYQKLFLESLFTPEKSIIITLRDDDRI